MQLPLLGGEDVIHDWNFLFVKHGLLRQTALVSGLVYAAGIITLLGSMIVSIVYSFTKNEEYE